MSVLVPQSPRKLGDGYDGYVGIFVSSNCRMEPEHVPISFFFGALAFTWRSARGSLLRVLKNGKASRRGS